MDQMPRQRMEDERKRSILAAATRCFVRQGYGQTRLVDIAREAGLSKGGVYFHYRAKEDLFRDLVEAHLEAVRARWGFIPVAADRRFHLQEWSRVKGAGRVCWAWTGVRRRIGGSSGVPADRSWCRCPCFRRGDRGPHLHPSRRRLRSCCPASGRSRRTPRSVPRPRCRVRFRRVLTRTSSRTPRGWPSKTPTILSRCLSRHAANTREPGRRRRKGARAPTRRRSNGRDAPVAASVGHGAGLCARRTSRARHTPPRGI